MRKIWLLALAGLFATPVYADFTGKNTSGTTITFKNPADCTSVVCVPIFSLFDPTGTNGAAVPTAGADGVSNTANGLLSYGRNLVFNGTTWDRWQGAVTNAGTFAVQLSGASNNINNIAGAISLPTGAATAANQTTNNTSVASIDTKTPSLGQALAAASVPVILPAATITTLTPPAAITGFATSANQTTNNTSVASIDTKTPSLGQALAAASVPVILPSATITTLTPPAAITGFATAANQATEISSLATIATNSAASVPYTVNGTPTAATALTPGSAQTGTIIAPNSDITSWGGVAVGAMANYGTSPGAVKAPGVNAFVTNPIPAGTNLMGKVGIDQTTPGTTNAVQLTAATAATPIAAAASDNHAVLKNGAGIAMSVHTSNNSATKNYLRLYDAGTGFNGCNSATGVIFAMEIPPSDSGFSVSLGGGAGISFTNGLSWCITSGFGLTDTTNATASAIYANASYR